MITKPHWTARLVFFFTMVFLYVPLLYIIFQTFLVDPYHWRSGFTAQWLLKLFQSNSLWIPLLNSLSIAIASATLACAVGTLGAVGLHSKQASVPLSVQTLIFLPILLPEVITGLSLLLFFLLCRVRLGIFTIILAHASFSASFVYFIMKEQLRKLDAHIHEAAIDLGATPSQAFWKVTLPNIMPGLAGGWLMAFTLSFDDFLISFFTSGAGVTTLPLRIYSLMRIGLSPELSGLSFVMIVISTFLVLVLMRKEENRKWMVRG